MTSKLIASPISDKLRAYKQAQDVKRRAIHSKFKQDIRISNTKMATRLPYDSNSTTNYSRFNVDTMSRVKLELTENEIIDSVLHDNKRHHGKTDLRKYDATCIASAVVDYWRSRVGLSEIKRGRLYKKTQE